jgi:hypothetical protein
MARTVELFESGEYSTMASTWRDRVHLTQRKDGSHTAKIHRRGDYGRTHRHCSQPFRSGLGLLEALSEIERHSSYELFADDEIESMLNAARELCPGLVSDARRLLVGRPWSEWDRESVETSSVTKFPLD